MHVFTFFLKSGVPLDVPQGLYSGTSLGETTRGILGGYPGRVLSENVCTKNYRQIFRKMQHLCKDVTNNKMERMKNTIYKRVMECLQIWLPLSKKVSSEKYIELTNIIIPDIVENCNEYLPFRVTMDLETTKK